MQAAALDLESQEQENDRGIDALGDRVGMLRQVQNSGSKSSRHFKLLDRLNVDHLSQYHLIYPCHMLALIFPSGKV